jgi:bifunctional non-homologous end joining protein LigD
MSALETVATATTANALIHSLALSGDLAQNAAAVKKGAHVGYPTGHGYWMEPKLDGWRIIANVYENGVHFYSRSGNAYDGKLPKVEAELLANFPPGTWLDGEAVAIRVENGKIINDWGVAQSVLSKLGGHAAADKITYMVFDLIAHRGIDARPLELVDRRVLLERIFEGEDFEAVQLAPIREAQPETHDAFVAAGYEGTIVKQANRPYASGKREGAGWTKIKPSTTIDAVVMGFKPGENGFAGMVGAVIFGQYDDAGNLVERGRCSGMDMRTRESMTKNPDKWLDTVIEVAHMGVMKDGLRHPQFRRHRLDRKPESVLIHDA